MLAPPRPPSHEQLEALIREARERQRRRRIVIAAVVAVAAAVGLSARAAIPGGHPARQAGHGGSQAAISQRSETGLGQVPIVEVGSSGGVTWAINGNGMWVTTNGGRTWRASAPRDIRRMGDFIQGVRQVDFFDRRHGWVVSDAGFDWTRDGGRTWHRTMPNSCCGSVSFVTPSHGFSLLRSQLVSTTNGGKSWARVASAQLSWGVPTFVDSRRGVAVAGKGDLFNTTDGGRRWTAIRLPGNQAALPGVVSFGPRLVVPAERELPGRGGPDVWRLVVYASRDGGSRWTAHPAPRWWAPVIGSNDAQMFSAASPSVWFAAGWRKLAVTTDAGRSWRLVKVTDLPQHSTISAISFTSPRVGWAVFQSYTPPAAPRSPRSVLMRTTDGGEHWTPAGPRARRHHPRR